MFEFAWTRSSYQSPNSAGPALHPSWQRLPDLKAVLSRFVTNLAGKPFDDSVPDEWKRHQLAHTAAENVSYTPILARALSSESSTLSSFVTNLTGKRFWYDGFLAHYTILARPYRSESSTLTFCHKHSRKIYRRLCSRCTEKTLTGSHLSSTYVVA